MIYQCSVPQLTSQIHCQIIHSVFQF
uniref:Uncharacterized protein n=1 Tax=Arundo donax TaxID=35708 RepID=A0A0A8Y7D0_ARUDO